MRHLQFRNIENLRFIEQEAAHARDFGFRDDYSEDEREMYAALSRTAAGPPSYFLSMAVNMQQFALHWDRASIAVIRSRVPLRSSTNPALVIPRKLGHIKLFEELEAGAFCYWLPLSPHFGVMLTMSHRFNDFVADSGDCGQRFRLNATMHSDRRRPPVPTKAAGVSLPA